ncbi:ankyrin repeat domain-containing protein [Xylanibacillus composti]|uniref:Ankyrin repeat domain-containing protein n=1 Tax=Xylanibacillus composti TaxID=1572762 RepID=A0A8J4GZG7_9BACL|nr:ankyrin repeat domain-containing protein [Xylanibacillus composti]GIQ68087.1 hypothetical protein XYCOK13_09110 [Xylanibacillus composti]
MLEQLMIAAKEGDTETMRILLQEHPELLHETMENGESPLTAAMYYGRRNSVELLLQLGVTVTVHEAAMLGDADTVAYLLDQEPSLLDTFSFDGWTPLHLACFFGGHEAAELLIQRGAQLNIASQNEMANCPIHAAAAGKRTLIVKLLLEHGADPNVQQHGGWTPLHQAANNFDVGMVELLLAYQADPTIAEKGGMTPRQLAEEKGYEEIIAALDKGIGQNGSTL